MDENNNDNQIDNNDLETASSDIDKEAKPKKT